jgi:hypothetical protein
VSSCLLYRQASAGAGAGVGVDVDVGVDVGVGTSPGNNRLPRGSYLPPLAIPSWLAVVGAGGRRRLWVIVAGDSRPSALAATGPAVAGNCPVKGPGVKGEEERATLLTIADWNFEGTRPVTEASVMSEGKGRDAIRTSLRIIGARTPSLQFRCRSHNPRRDGLSPSEAGPCPLFRPINYPPWSSSVLNRAALVRAIANKFQLADCYYCSGGQSADL